MNIAGGDTVGAAPGLAFEAVAPPDLAAFTEGNLGAAAVVPEPGSLVSLAVGAPGLLRRRR